MCITYFQLFWTWKRTVLQRSWKSLKQEIFAMLFPPLKKDRPSLFPSLTDTIGFPFFPDFQLPEKQKNFKKIPGNSGKFSEP